MTRQSNAAPRDDDSPVRDEFVMGMPLHLLESLQAEMGARLANLEGTVFSLRRRLVECEQHLRSVSATTHASECDGEFDGPVLVGNAPIKCAAD